MADAVQSGAGASMAGGSGDMLPAGVLGTETYKEVVMQEAGGTPN